MQHYADGTVVMVGDEVEGIADCKNHWTELLEGCSGFITAIEKDEDYVGLSVEVRTENHGRIWMNPSDLLPVGKGTPFDETVFLSLIGGGSSNG